MCNDEIKPLMDWLMKDLPSPQPRQSLPSRGTKLRWEQQKKDDESGRVFTELEKRIRFRQLWLLELEADAHDMEADGNDGWPPNFVVPMGLKAAVVKGILSADGWTPLKEKLRVIRELKEELHNIEENTTSTAVTFHSGG